MTKKAIFVQVTVYDEKSNQVIQQVVRHYDGSYGFEIERMFGLLADEIVQIIDPVDR